MVGIAAAAVQVIELPLWVLLIPAVSDNAADPSLTDQAHHRAENLHFWLGAIIGYTLTAAFTVLVVSSFTRTAISGRWAGYLGYTEATLIATGVLLPLGLAERASPTSSATSPGASGSPSWPPSCGAHL